MATGSLTAHPGKYLKGDHSFDSIRGETNPVLSRPEIAQPKVLSVLFSRLR